jgi:hypothetical protein
MACLLAQMLAYPIRRDRTQGGDPNTFHQEILNEVTEHQGALLVRLGGGFAMQVRVEPDSASVTIRMVPIANATQLNLDLPWLLASEAQLREWMEQGSAIGQWLTSKGLMGERLVSGAWGSAGFAGNLAGAASLP